MSHFLDEPSPILTEDQRLIRKLFGSSYQNPDPPTTPMKTYPALIEIRSGGSSAISGTRPVGQIQYPHSSYWSWTFGITSFPFLFWGCPFYLLTGTSRPITSTRSWFKRIFQFCSFPLTTLLSVFLLIPTCTVNAYAAWVIGEMFYSMFISGQYKLTFATDFVQLIRYIPIVVPLDYVWLFGYQISNIIGTLNQIHGKYGDVGCRIVRCRLGVMLLAIIAIQVIRYVFFEKYEVTGKANLFESLKNGLEFSLDVYCSFLLPLYCTFCQAIRFEFHCIKAYLYALISERIRPNVEHLSEVKTLYTTAADHIMTINNFFSIYLSLAILIMILGTVLDAENLWGGIIKIAGGGGMLSGLIKIIGAIAKSGTKESDDDVLLFADTGRSGQNETTTVQGEPAEEGFTPSEIREINLDIACVILTYLLIFYTIWQAVVTNDCVRDIHVWLNDFVTGGGGTDVHGALESLGVAKSRKRIASTTGTGSGGDTAKVVEEEERIERDYFLSPQLPLVWAGNNVVDGEKGSTDEFIKKFRNLKAFIHVRMQTERPALLNIALLNLLAPPLNNRLRRYRIVF